MHGNAIDRNDSLEKPVNGAVAGTPPSIERELPVGWRWLSMSDVCSKVQDGTHFSPKEQFATGDYKYITAKNIKPWGLDLSELTYVSENTHREIAKRCNPEKGDVLYIKDGVTTGIATVNTLDEEFSLLSSVALLKPRREIIDSYFLKYYLNSPEGLRNMTGQMTGTAIKRLILQKIRQARIPVAPLTQQRCIVAEIEKQFTRLDAGVASLKRVQAALKRYRASVLKAACEGRLVPTEAKLARQGGRSYEPASELLARISRERRKHWESEQLAKFKAVSKAPKDEKWRAKYKEPFASISADYKHDDLPGGWTWATWDQVGFVHNGRPFPSSEYQLSGFKLLRPGNLHASGKIVWTADNSRCMPMRWAAENPDLIVGSRQLVMNLTAQSLKDEFLGRVCLTSEGEECLLNQRLARLTPVLILPEYMLYLLKSWRFRRFVDGLNSGSLIQHMFTSQLAAFVFPLPPLAEQKRIVEEVERRLTAVEELEAVLAANLKRAERLCQSILQRAFSGQL